MNKKLKNIEQLYSESFSDFRVEPSSGLWKKISTKLAWRSFFSFNPTTINAYYVASLLTLATAGALILTKPVSDKKQNINEITINNTIKNSVITPMQENKTEPKGIIIPEESRKSEAGSRKQEANNQKPKSGINDQTTSNQKPVTSNQILDSSTNDQTPRTQNPTPSTREPATRIVSRSEAKVDNPKPVITIIPQLATPHPKPQTPNPTSNQKPATSNQSPDPWLNIDSLFTNQTPTTPQHTIEFPNAFTPNSNGPTNGYYTPGAPNNDVFHPEYKGVVEYHLSIFNRRGELIFESNEINTGWDGYINDRLAAQGVYVWKARGRFSNGENFIKAGNVMLIKK